MFPAQRVFSVSLTTHRQFYTMNFGYELDLYNIEIIRGFTKKNDYLPMQ